MGQGGVEPEASETAQRASSTSDLTLIRPPVLNTNSDEMSEFPEESRLSAGKWFYDSDPITDTNGHPTDT